MTSRAPKETAEQIKHRETLARKKFEQMQAAPAEKPRHTDPLPWTRRGKRLTKKNKKAGGA
jgi:hypothetical protein